jgi:hypothetical protein
MKAVYFSPYFWANFRNPIFQKSLSSRRRRELTEGSDFFIFRRGEKSDFSKKLVVPTPEGTH